ncbi:esterase family protein [Pseudonocardia kujensis]|uniref:alpha/beta hydrolase n=1 Tax=Pseudonocardia kujensis TaxID=1128675 RepID=UPI001E52EB2D|nr:alpha/beta hydrolase-fold protein [Pseudonocardia kujensis]MCE0763715.1 esterase family protein [Pseudonocardia kujensis]
MDLSRLLDAPLIAGPLPTTVTVVGAVAGVALLVGRGRRWWLWSVPVAAMAGAVAVGLVLLVMAVFRPFPDPLPPRVLVWIGVVVAAFALAAPTLRRRWWRAGTAVLAALLVLATGAIKVNAVYGYRPTLNAALGLPFSNQVDLADVPAAPLLAASPAGPLASAWTPPADMPRRGRISEVTVPGTVSGFAARPAWVYLPPAYLTSPRPRLPVLELVAGQPGGPEDWLLAGRLAEVMDSFAAAHAGLAPVVVVPDATGSDLANTLCLDSRLGNAETYLARDVPDWAAANLQVAPGPLAIGGFSFGGTCALQLALRHPDTFPTFLDVSGQAEPTLGDRPSTVAAAFGGDDGAFDQVTPLSELRRRTYPALHGTLIVGRDDDTYRPQAEQVAAASRAAGATLALVELPAGHSWSLASQALGAALPWLAGRLGILAPVPPPS